MQQMPFGSSMPRGLLRIKIVALEFDPQWQHPMDYIVRFVNGQQVADLIPKIIHTETVWMELMSDSLEMLVTNRHATSQEIGFAEIRLTQMLKYQETLHKVNVHMAVRDNTKGWLQREAGKAIIEILYSSRPVNGTLTIKIASANLTRDTQLISKMDPYVILKYLGKEYKTKVKNEAGKNPVWNQMFQLMVPRINETMQLIVMDDDVTRDDEVGRTVFNLRELGLINPNQNQRLLELVYFKSKNRDKPPVPAGTISIETQFSF